MLEGKYLLFGDCFDDIIQVRNQCIDSRNVVDLMDSEAIHVIVYEDKEPIACGRMLIENDKAIFDHIYVIENKRRNKVGDFTLRLLIEKANVMCFGEIELRCDENNRKFFESLGFVEVKEPSNTYMDSIKMILDLDSLFNKKNCCK
ncbi:GNAT family N-acetyltransferase [Anaerosporobacter sp.]